MIFFFSPIELQLRGSCLMGPMAHLSALWSQFSMGAADLIASSQLCVTLGPVGIQLLIAACFVASAQLFLLLSIM